MTKEKLPERVEIRSRLLPEHQAALVASARQNHRTLGAEIAYRLEATLASEANTINIVESWPQRKDTQ